MGSCTAGGAYVPAMSDEAIIVREQGTIFLAGPPLGQGGNGRNRQRRGTWVAVMSTPGFPVSPIIWPKMTVTRWPLRRRAIANLNRTKTPDIVMQTPEEPAYDPDEILGVVPGDLKTPYDIREVIARMVDGSRFDEFKSRYGTTLVCGFAHVMGMPVGIIANNGVLFSESAVKGAHFVELCSQRKIPLALPAKYNRLHGGPEIRAGRHRQGWREAGDSCCNHESPQDSPCWSVALSVPAITAWQAGPIRPDFLWTWPNSRISVMGGEQAAGVLATVKRDGHRAQGRHMVGRRRSSLQTTDPRHVRGTGPPALCLRPALG